MTNQRSAAVFCARARVYIYSAALALLAVAPACASDSIPDLVKALNDPRYEARAAASEALVTRGPQVVPALLDYAVNDRSRRRVERLLLRMGHGAVPVLLAQTKEPSRALKAGGLLFFLIGPDSSEQAPALLACLRKQPDVKNYCGQALVKVMAPGATKHVSMLVEALGDGDADVRMYAAAALGLARARAAVPSLISALKDPASRVRLGAVTALSKIGEPARQAVPALQELAAGTDSPELKRAVEEALKSIHG